jgi:hypothetical protein
VRIFQRPAGRAGLDGLPDHLPNHEAGHSALRPPLPAGHDFAARAQLPQLHLRQRQSLRDIEGEPVLEIHPDDAAARGIARRRWCGCSTTGAATVQGRGVERARPGVVNGLGIWWRKLGLNGTNVNELTSQALTDLGRGPVFYDCLVEVCCLRSPMRPGVSSSER